MTVTTAVIAHPDLNTLLARASSVTTFPVEVLDDCHSVACFFCAGFYGVYEVIHFDKVAKSMTLVDKDEEKVRHMGTVYRTRPKVIVGDAFATAATMHAEGQRFDVVSCDPWSNMMPLPVSKHFLTFARLAKRYLVAGVTADNLTKDLGLPEASPASLEHYLSQFGDGIAVEKLVLRNAGLQNGVFWAPINLTRATLR
jgi:hypothetical protein